jgi:mannitol/fructose-specific phosphotransferase system IIA component
MPTDIYIRDEYAATGVGDKIVLPEGTIRKKTNVRSAI